MIDLRNELSHVLWVGGGPQAGKTTLSRLLGGKWDLKVYSLDWHGASASRERPGPAEAAFARMSMDERWARPSVEELVERSIAIWRERFAHATEELLALPRTRTIVAEGPGALPWLVAPIIDSPRRAIFLVPTAERRRAVELRRFGPGQVTRFPGIVDREGALAKLSRRDALIDEKTRAFCATHDLRCLTVDGSMDLDSSLALLEEHFKPYLPATANV